MWWWRCARSSSLSLHKQPMGLYNIFKRKLQLQKGGIQGDAHRQWAPDPFQGILPGILPQPALQHTQALGALSVPWQACWVVTQCAVKQYTDTQWIPPAAVVTMTWMTWPSLSQSSVQEYCPLGMRGWLCCYSLQVIPWGNCSQGKAEGLELLCQVNITDFDRQAPRKATSSYTDVKYTHK